MTGEYSSRKGIIFRKVTFARPVAIGSYFVRRATAVNVFEFVLDVATFVGPVKLLSNTLPVLFAKP